MEIRFHVTANDRSRFRSFFDSRSDHRFVVERRRRNIEGLRPRVTRSEVWEALLSGLLTTQQRSGPGSPVNRFVSKRPFPLPLVTCQKANLPDKTILARLQSWGGIRRGSTISQQAADNLRFLETGGWEHVLGHIRSLEAQVSRDLERSAAFYLQQNLKGVGPKQSRNILQMLGVTRFETPLDSRITKWLNDFGFPIKLSATLLADEEFYRFVSDGFQALCRETDVWPCLMDAAIFTSFDKQEWTEAAMRW